MQNYIDKHAPTNDSFKFNEIFPVINVASTTEIIEISKRFFKKKVISFDGISEKLIKIKKGSNIKNLHKKIKFLKSIFDQELLNNDKIKQCFIGRLIPINKIKEIENVNDLRPIIALSLIAKLLECLLLKKLENEINRRCSTSQIRFIKKCNTQMNISKLTKLISKDYRIILFIDLKQAYDSIP